MYPRLAISAPRSSERPKLGHDLRAIPSTVSREQHLTHTATHLKLKHKLNFDFHTGLAIFMGLVYFKGIAWQYTAETLSIVFVQLAVAVFARKGTLTPVDGALILAIYPASVVLVAGLEAMGFD